MCKMKDAVELTIEWDALSPTVQERTKGLYVDLLGKILFSSTLKAPEPVITLPIMTRGAIWRCLRDNDGSTVRELANILKTKEGNIYNHLTNLRKCGRVRYLKGRAGLQHNWFISGE